MTTIIVSINHGRYIAQCPKCYSSHVVEQAQSTLVCPACWKGLNAVKFGEDMFGALVQVPHTEMIFYTRDQAAASEEEYSLALPDPQIMEILRPRPVENMNWEPGETIEFLQEENAAHGLEGA